MGNELFEKVIQLSGLPRKQIKKELTNMLKREGIKPQTMTEPILRKVLASYLREVIQKVTSRNYE